MNGPLTTQTTFSCGFAQSALRALVARVLRDVDTTSVGAIPPPTSAWPVGRLLTGSLEHDDGVRVDRQLVVVVHQEQPAETPGGHEPDRADHEKAAHAHRVPPASVVLG